MHSILLVALLCSGDQTLEEWFRDFSQDVQIIGYKHTLRNMPEEGVSEVESNSAEETGDNAGEDSEDDGAYFNKDKWLRFNLDKGFHPLFSNKQMEMLRGRVGVSLHPESETLAIAVCTNSMIHGPPSLFLMEGDKLRMLVGFESKGGLEPLLKLEGGEEGKKWKKALNKGALGWSEDGKRVVLLSKKIMAWIDVQSGENNIIDLKDGPVRGSVRALAPQPGAKPLMWNKKISML